MTVLQVCAYAAPYPGNFIASMKLLEEKLLKQGHETIYAFPETARDKEWCKELAKQNRVYYLPVAKARILPKTYTIFRKIYRENNVHLTHSHFGLYDIPATITAPRTTKIYWHLHDALRHSKKIGRNLINKFQYRYFSGSSTLISASEYYRKKVVELGFKEKNTCTILNGIDLSRIENCFNKEKPFDFLAFGWDFHIKGVDVTLKALEKLHRDGYIFKLVLVGLEQTREQIEIFFKNDIPDWIEVSNSVTNVNELYKNSHIFIQASRIETFSYAACEATYAGLPVVASDIPGLEWGKSMPTIRFFNSEDADDLYLNLKQLLNQDYIVNEKEINISKKNIENHFSLEIWVYNIMNCYNLKKLLGKK